MLGLLFHCVATRQRFFENCEKSVRHVWTTDIQEHYQGLRMGLLVSSLGLCCFSKAPEAEDSVITALNATRFLVGIAAPTDTRAAPGSKKARNAGDPEGKPSQPSAQTAKPLTTSAFT